MKINIQLLSLILGAFGFISSIFYGLKAFKIFEVNSDDKSVSWKIHQIWFNFLGSIIGWLAFIFLIVKALKFIELNTNPAINISEY